MKTMPSESLRTLNKSLYVFVDLEKCNLKIDYDFDMKTIKKS